MNNERSTARSSSIIPEPSGKLADPVEMPDEPNGPEQEVRPDAVRGHRAWSGFHSSAPGYRHDQETA